jgi:uncharacterized protein (DUF433 family)
MKPNSQSGKSVMKSITPVVHSDSDILGGTPVFVGTRVPVKTLIDYLEAGVAVVVLVAPQAEN